MVEIIDGPVAPGGSGIIYQVTLASGAIVTNPSAFPTEGESKAETVFVWTEDGLSLMRRDSELPELTRDDGVKLGSDINTLAARIVAEATVERPDREVDEGAAAEEDDEP